MSPEDHRSMYGDQADLYDRMYHWKDYEGEAVALRAQLMAEGVAPGARLLEAAVGTGAHLAHLADHFEVAGFDLNEGMLRVARHRLPGVPLWQADMREFTVEVPYDVIICMFSSIGYLTDRAQLAAAAACFAASLPPGGLLVVEPWFTVEQWRVGNPNLQTYDSADLKLARGTVSSIDGEIAVMDMHWLVLRRGRPAEHFVDTHRMWLCPRSVLLDVFAENGFSMRFQEEGLPGGRGLLIGRRAS
jgi:cyclopropane fatty-acyl-phospholipid synthase-like methyltransferase